MARIANLTDIAQQVEIYLANGQKTTIRVMPRRKVDLAPGEKVVQNWIALNPKVLKVFDEQSYEHSSTSPKVPSSSQTSLNSGE